MPRGVLEGGRRPPSRPILLPSRFRSCSGHRPTMPFEAGVRKKEASQCDASRVTACRYGRLPVGNGQAAAGFSAVLAPGAAVAAGAAGAAAAAGAAGLAAGFLLAAGFFAFVAFLAFLAFLATFFLADFLADFLAAFWLTSWLTFSSRTSSKTSWQTFSWRTSWPISSLPSWLSWLLP